MKTEKSITERIKTYADACRELGIHVCPPKVELMSDDEYAYYMLKVISKALNEGWVPDWTDASQYKYFPVFEVTKGAHSEILSVYSTFAFSYAPMHFGSRLAYKSRDLAEYAGIQFNEIYAIFIL